jgi:hypothetical protein
MIENTTCPGGETGRRTGLKIPSLERDVPVRFRSRAPLTTLSCISALAAANLLPTAANLSLGDLRRGASEVFAREGDPLPQSRLQTTQFSNAKWSTRFCCQHRSLFCVQNGFSFP